MEVLIGAQKKRKSDFALQLAVAEPVAKPSPLGEKCATFELSVLPLAPRFRQLVLIAGIWVKSPFCLTEHSDLSGFVQVATDNLRLYRPFGA